VVQNKIFSVNKTLHVQGRIINLSTPAVMGIINITPDSFYEGSRAQFVNEILTKAETMLRDGATFIDIGGYSSRPGATDISIEVEWQRVQPAISSIRKEFPQAIISIDTFRSGIARNAVNEGCDIVNDISAGQLDTKMFTTVAELNVPYIAMHMRGTPQTMSQLTDYENLIKEIIDYFHSIISQLHSLKVKDIVIDPGFGFAKTVAQNFELLDNLQQLQVLGKPMLVGLSRKSMIWRTLKTTPEQSLNGTTALNTIALLKGASILRVHDVKETMEVINLLNQFPSTE
jgi:dihydropteroate synthase